MTKELALLANTYTGYNNNFGILFPQSGKFAGRSTIKWYACREEFATGAWEGNRSTLHEGGFLFFHNVKTSEDIAEFVERFEVLLEGGRRKPIQRSLIQKVSTGGVIVPLTEKMMTWCEPGPFWFKQSMRFSLFTMLLRCANLGYVAGDGGDFWSALFLSYNLAQGTKASIVRFLDGYTWYKGRNNGLVNGWYNTFHGLETHAANADGWKVLVRPKPKPVKPDDPDLPDAVLKNIATVA